MENKYCESDKEGVTARVSQREAKEREKVRGLEWERPRRSEIREGQYKKEGI